jgi:murein DD-endopeptidase MepM/ murein hydrolase activator NlpD
MKLLASVLMLGVISFPAAGFELTGDPVQGGLMQGRAAPGSSVTLDGATQPVTPNGEFLIGFGRDAAKSALLNVREPGRAVAQRKITIRQRKYDIERIDGLPKKKVSPGKRDMKRIVAESKLLRAARQHISLKNWFRGGFVWPARGRISGIYGSQRFLNGKPRRPHLGVDVAAPTGAPVLATADGVVTVVHGDMFFTGKTIYIDHGLGLGSIYAHMSATEVKQGQRVRKGQRIGRIGMTGRVTGPHLHWGMTWREIRLDPALLVGAMKKAKKRP